MSKNKILILVIAGITAILVIGRLIIFIYSYHNTTFPVKELNPYEIAGSNHPAYSCPFGNDSMLCKKTSLNMGFKQDYPTATYNTLLFNLFYKIYKNANYQTTSNSLSGKVLENWPNPTVKYASQCLLNSVSTTPGEWRNILLYVNKHLPLNSLLQFQAQEMMCGNYAVVQTLADFTPPPSASYLAKINSGINEYKEFNPQTFFSIHAPTSGKGEQ